MTDMDAEKLLLNDGRHLAWQVFGDPVGSPVFYCHGFPGSRLDGALVAHAARSTGVRLIAADRPGFGLSDFKRDRRLGDWTADLVALADHLGLKTLALLGVSGGGPFAMATATALPERITRLGLVCGLGSLAPADATTGMSAVQAAYIGLSRLAPTMSRQINTWIAGPVLRRFPSVALRLLASAAPLSDREILADPEVRKRLLATTREAFRQGGRGAAWELYLFTQGWDLDPSQISVPTLLWHGEADTTVPVAMGRRHAASIPNCQCRFLPDEGHFSLPIRHAAEILGALTAD